MMHRAMHPAYASGITDLHMPNAKHVRTNELTDEDASKTESGSLVLNAHEREARIYIVEWEHYSFVKVGITRGERFRTFVGRGGTLRSLTEPMPVDAALALEASVHRAMRSANWPQQFPCKEAAVPFLGHDGAGWTECYRMGVEGLHIDQLAARRAANQ